MNTLLVEKYLTVWLLLFRNVLAYNYSTTEELESYISKYLVYALLWSFAGDTMLEGKLALSHFICSNTTVPLPPRNLSIIDYEVCFSILFQCQCK